MLDYVVTISVPHHGSINNFHEELSSLGPDVFVVTARNGNRHHPHQSVRDMLESHFLIHVNEEQD